MKNYTMPNKLPYLNNGEKNITNLKKYNMMKMFFYFILLFTTSVW